MSVCTCTMPFSGSLGVSHGLRIHISSALVQSEFCWQMMENCLLKYPGRHSYIKDVPMGKLDSSVLFRRLANENHGGSVHWPKVDGAKDSSRTASWTLPWQKATRRPTVPRRFEIPETFIFFTGVSSAVEPQSREGNPAQGAGNGAEFRNKGFDHSFPLLGGVLFTTCSWGFCGNSPGRSLHGCRHRTKNLASQFQDILFTKM